MQVEIKIYLIRIKNLKIGERSTSRIVLLNEASDKKFTVGGNEFQTLMTCSAKRIYECCTDSVMCTVYTYGHEYLLQ